MITTGRRRNHTLELSDMTSFGNSVGLKRRRQNLARLKVKRDKNVRSRIKCNLCRLMMRVNYWEWSCFFAYPKNTLFIWFDKNCDKKSCFAYEHHLTLFFLLLNLIFRYFLFSGFLPFYYPEETIIENIKIYISLFLRVSKQNKNYPLL